MLLVYSLEEVNSLQQEIQKLGYHALGEYGIPGRRYFTKDEDGERIFQIHTFHFQDPKASQYLLFRDYLNNYPEKQKLIQSSNKN